MMVLMYKQNGTWSIDQTRQEQHRQHGERVGAVERRRRLPFLGAATDQQPLRLCH
jgi:hypothetical protein